MIYDLMKAIETSQIFSLDKLSEDLGLDKSLLENLIANLVSKGFLKADNLNRTSCGGCVSNCSSCHLSSTDAINIYSITERGQKFIDKKESTN